MRILHVNKFYPPWIGGIETIVSEISEMLQSTGHTNTVLVCQSPIDSKQSEILNGVQMIRTKTLGSFFGMPISFDFFFAFKRASHNTDVILLHHPFPLGFLAAFLFARKKRLVIFYHADIVRQKNVALLLSPLFHTILSRASDILVTSDQLTQSSPLLLRYQKKCTTIPLWINERNLKQTSETEQTSENIKQTFGHPLLLSVGRLVSYKGYEFLIDALQSVSAHALIIGTGPLKQPLLERIHRNNLDDRVMIIDPVEDLAPYYYAASFFVLPSITNAEAFGIVQLEAMFCGCPVINTSLPTGVPEVSIHNQTGLTVEPKNTIQLAQAINTLLKNNALRKQFSERAHARAVTHFSKIHSFRIIESILSKTAV